MDPAEGTLEVVERPDGVFEVTGQLDLGNASLFRNAIRTAVEPGARIVLDFRAVTFMDSSGLQALVTVASDVAPGGATISKFEQLIVGR